MQRHEATQKQRRNAVITAVVLAALALGIYHTLIAKSVVYG